MEAASKFKDRVRHEREQEILDAARDVFAARGFERASIDDIADRVGIGKGTVYLHFASKEDILIGLMLRGIESLTAQCRLVIDGRGTPLDKLRMILRRLVDHRFANERWMRIVASELPHFVGHERREGVSARLRALVAELVQQGQAAGQIDRRIQPAHAAIALFALVFVAPSVSCAPRQSKQELLESAEQLFFHGLIKEVEQ